jgi:hypothetical protein
MVKNYAALNSNTTLGFNKKFQKSFSTENNSATMKSSWFFMVLFLLGLVVAHEATANNNSTLIFTKHYTYKTVIIKPSRAYGHSGGGGHGDALFSPTDHDKPHYYREVITTTTKTNKLLHYNITHTVSNTKTNPS